VKIVWLEKSTSRCGEAENAGSECVMVCSMAFERVYGAAELTMEVRWQAMADAVQRKE